MGSNQSSDPSSFNVQVHDMTENFILESSVKESKPSLNSLPEQQPSTFSMNEFRKSVRNLWSINAGEENLEFYAHRDLPKITMETLSATGFSFIIWVSYLSLIAAVIMYVVLNDGSKKNIQMNGAVCGSTNASMESIYDHGVSNSCSEDQANNQTIFAGNITKITNLIGNIEMYVFVPAGKIDNSSIPSLDVNIELQGCTTEDIFHCKYETVLMKDDTFGFESYYSEDGSHYYRGIILDTFQNQEIIQNNGILLAYKFNVTYKDNKGLVGGSDVGFYEFHYYSVYNPLITKVMQSVLCGFTVIYAIIWFKALLQEEADPRKWLQERKRLSWLLLGLFFFQNPIYCITQWYIEVKYRTGWTAYLSSLMTFIGQAIIFTVFLLIADGIAENTHFFSDLPKIVFGLLMLLIYTLMISIDYPTIFNPDRSPILSVMNWSISLQIRYAILGIILLLMIIYWIIYFIFTTMRTGKKLRKVLYIKARQQNLVYRFFLLQAFLVTAVLIVEYVVDFWNIFISGTFVFRRENIADYLNALFNSQNESLCYILFISVYVYLTLYLYLPVDRANMHHFLSRSYVLREAEISSAKDIRHQDLQQLKRFGLFVPKSVERKPIFCVETARWMMELSFQAYFDPPEKEVSTTTFGQVDVGQFGFVILDFLWDQEHDTNCFVLKHKTKKKLVVVFRGSMSREHWADNLKFHLQAIDMHTLCPRGKEEQQPIILGENFSEYMQASEKKPTKPFLTRVQHNVQNLPMHVVQASRAGVEFVKEELETAADVTRINRIPGLKYALTGHVHTGFWEAYACVREELHRSVRRHLLDEELQLFCTGHSLGGALASLASADLMVHTIPKVNAVWASRRGLESDIDFEGMCSITMYNFGSPRVGNSLFSSAFNKLIPHSFRVVVDGDLVAGLPPSIWYRHLGTEVIIDGDGSGNLIIDPSVAEKKLQIRTRANAILHDLKHYRNGLCSILGERIERQVLEDLVVPSPRESAVDSLPEQVENVGGLGRIGFSLHQATSMVRNMFQTRKTRSNSIDIKPEPKSVRLLTDTLL